MTDESCIGKLPPIFFDYENSFGHHVRILGDPYLQEYIDFGDRLISTQTAIEHGLLQIWRMVPTGWVSNQI